ncbi:hypothetical protein F4819DRAFT_488448 [Hypoxylon fuscum]|nr:hypothetical protein F4819DRAFT_488448 [Hypoxylon fuscum]
MEESDISSRATTTRTPLPSEKTAVGGSKSTTGKEQQAAPRTDSDADADADLEEEEQAEPMYPTVPCPCPCHENTAAREGRPWLAFGNAAYLVCPLCWVDAYMRAHGDGRRGRDCEAYLRARGKDPRVPASRQC